MPAGIGGAIAAGHPETVEAARIALEAGGNAFDAALAGMAAAFVAEPVLASPGGGGFLLAGRAGHAPVAYDFFARTPKHKRPVEEIDFHAAFADFGTTRQEFHIGMGATATPGAIPGMFRIHGDLCRLPMRNILAPAIAAAERGIEINRFQAKVLGVVAPIYRATEGARGLYAGNAAGTGLLAEGDRLVNPDLAGCLTALAGEGPALFSHGEVATRIAGLSRDGGGHLTEADLSSYVPGNAPPLVTTYRGWRIATNPAPSTGGVLVALGLALLQRLGDRADGSPESHARLAAVLAETDSLKAAGRMAAEDLLDPETVAVATEAARQRLVASRGTTHISVIDRGGNCAALTLSNGEGNGIVVPGCGFMLNNVLGEEDINPGGFHRWTPDRPMGSMMAPTLMNGPGGEVAVLGSGGSNRIRSAVLQLVRNIAAGMGAADAVTAPRLHVEGGRIDIEPGPGEAALAAVRGLGMPVECWPEPGLFFGGAHVALARNGHAEAAGDARRDGAATCL